MPTPHAAELLARAHADAESVTALACELIRIPSRGGVDDYAPILSVTEKWLTDRGLPHRRLTDPHGSDVAILIEIHGARPGPTWVLDACLDTAEFGDESAWSFSPTVGDVVDNQLRGRGPADAKSGAAIFCHIAAALHDHRALAGTLAVLLDVDEHTGNFGGAKALLAALDPAHIAGAMIGYPGHDEIILGGRGVLRTRLHVHGEAGHSGSAKPHRVNAATRAARLALALHDQPLPPPRPGGFPLPPKLTITEIRSGNGFSNIPDHATIGIDIRLTDTLDAPAATRLITALVNHHDSDHPTSRPTQIEPLLSWPPYQLTTNQQPAAALLAATHALGLSPHPKIAGPSNIGNLLATHNIATTAGFGLPYTGLHATDEQADLTALPAVQAAYHHAALALLDNSAS